MKSLEVIALAEREFREAVIWYRDRDPRVAERFASEVRRTLTLIERFPRVGGSVAGVDDSSVRQMPVHHFPYDIVFVRLDDAVKVVAFAHHRRRPGYFLNRLR